MGWFCIGTALVLTLLRTLLPLYTPTQDEFNALLRAKLPYPTTVKTIALSWEGVHPVVALSDVTIKQAADAQAAIHADKLKLVLSVKHLLVGRVQLADLVVDGAKLSIDYRENDRITLIEIPDLYIDLKDPERHIPIDRLQIVNSQLDIQCAQNRVTLTEVAVNADLKSQLKVHVHANVQGQTGATVDANVETSLLNPFAIKGYVHWVGDELEKMLALQQLDLPFAHIKGHFDVKTWIHWQRNHLQVTANMALSDVEVMTHQKQKIAFSNLGGHFYVHHQNNDWRISFEQGFAEQTKDIALQLFTVPCEGGSCWQFKARHLPLKPFHDIAQLFDARLAVYEAIGEVDYVNLTLNQAKQPTLIEMVFRDVGIFKPTHGGIAGMTGALVFDEHQGALQLKSPRFNIHYPEWYSQVVPFTQMNADLYFTRHPEGFELVADHVEAQLHNTPIEGSAVLHFASMDKLPEVEMQWHIGHIDTTQVLALLPKVMDLDLLEWLNEALTAGELTETNFVLRGDLAEFPFDKQEGIFEVSAQLEHGELDYTPGWPALYDLKANLLFRNRSLFITAEHALIEGGELLNADAVIPDLLSPLPALRIDTKIASSLENGLSIVQKSPLKDTLGKELSVLQLEGAMGLSLGLDVPLSSASPDGVKVRGVIALNEALVKVPEWAIEIPHVAGEVSFTESTLKANKLSGFLLESPAEFQIATIPSDYGSELSISASGKIVAESLLNWIKAPELKQLSGDTDYQAQLLVTSAEDTKQVNLTLTSDLKGLTLDAPQPLAKQAAELKPSECKINFDPNNLTRISFKYGDSLNVAYSILRQGQVWRPMGGHIHLGENRLAKYREDGILLLDGEIGELDVEKWQQFAKQTGLGLPADKPTLEPLIELAIGNFKLMGEEFTKVGLEAEWENNFKRLNVAFDGPSLKGHMTLPQDETQDIAIDLQKLTLMNNSQVSSFWENQEHTEKKQPIDIKIKELNIDNKSFNEVQARLVPTAKGYDFNPVKAKLKDTSIELSGEWNYLNDKKVTARGTLKTPNIGEALQALGKEGTLKGANGTVDFTLEWEGTPAKIDYPTLGGQASLSLHQGYVQGVNPGIGRILSLLNLDNVKRRLKLDFGDVTKSGFAFDELTGKFQFGKGKVSTNKLILNGPSAKIEAFGQADLVSQGLSGEMVVMPDVTGSLPVAAAIASANPAIGAAVWVADKMFGNKIQEINRFRYQLLGSWQSPQVKEIPMVAIQGRG